MPFSLSLGLAQAATLSFGGAATAAAAVDPNDPNLLDDLGAPPPLHFGGPLVPVVDVFHPIPFPFGVVDFVLTQDHSVIG